MRASHHFAPVLALLAVVLAPAPHAQADVVGPPPASCPPGSVGEVCHGSSYCRPLACASDTDCAGGLVCREQGLCLGSVGCYGRLAPDSAPPPPRDTAERACSAGEACGGASCVVTSRCVPPPSAPSFSGCECRAAHPSHNDATGGLVVAGAFATACVVGTRARRRRRTDTRATFPR